MRINTNCEMCGAPMPDPLHCEYCGSRYMLEKELPPMPQFNNSFGSPYGVHAPVICTTTGAIDYQATEQIHYLKGLGNPFQNPPRIEKTG